MASELVPRPSHLTFDIVVSPMFDENCYIVRRPDSTDAVVIDPGLDPESIQRVIAEQHLQVKAILNTHGHSDHIAGNEFLKRCWPNAELAIGTGDADKLADPVLNLSAPFGLALISPPADRLLSDGERIEYAGLEFTVRDTPGHSRGHVVFLLDKEIKPAVVFGGDVLFRESVGRTDFPDADPTELAKSIKEVLYRLPDDTIVYPGHGPETTIGYEKMHNPFVPG